MHLGPNNSGLELDKNKGSWVFSIVSWPSWHNLWHGLNNMECTLVFSTATDEMLAPFYYSIDWNITIVLKLEANMKKITNSKKRIIDAY